MLSLPTRGVKLSIREHNSRLDALCDWLEGSLLFDEDEVSRTDVIAALIQEHIYENQDFAAEMVESAWTELQRRQSCIGNNAPLSVTSRRLTRHRTWQDVPAHSFCVLLALAFWHREWAHQFGADYTEQGELFELVTSMSLSTQLPGWVIHHTGWSRTNAVKLVDVVTDIATRLGESTGDLARWTEPNANEAGLDLLCYRPFPDNRVGVPLYLTQCASGSNWERKLKQPDLDLWQQIIHFAASPQRAVAIPFALVDEEFPRKCILVKGMLLDRYRLLAASQIRDDWVPQELKQRIIRWANPRVATLPRRDV